jgi:hypothetical protein
VYTCFFPLSHGMLYMYMLYMFPVSFLRVCQYVSHLVNEVNAFCMSKN